MSQIEFKDFYEHIQFKKDTRQHFLFRAIQGG